MTTKVKKAYIKPKAKTKADPKLFSNREMGWLKFNRRVLSETSDRRIPLLERLRFCQIFISNQDEFIMKRVGRFKAKIHSGQAAFSLDGKTVSEQLTLIDKETRNQLALLAQNFEKELFPLLKKENIHLLSWKNLKKDEKRYAKDYFSKNIFPILTPLAVDSAHPFPFISNLSLSLGICLRRPGELKNSFSRVKFPPHLPQWIQLPHQDGEDQYRFIHLKDVLEANLSSLFPGMEIVTVTLFRVFRSADWENEDEDPDDVKEMVEEGLRVRKFNPIIRMEYEEGGDPWIINFLQDELSLSEKDIYSMPSVVNYSRFNEILELDLPHLKYRPWTPVIPLQLSNEDQNIFSTLKKRDVFVHHPYENFNASVEKLLRDAAEDPKVLAIKLTLYRAGAKSKIIESLIRAAAEGKQVVVLIEITARFDEERNIVLAQQLESHGIHVVYGIAGLKTHSKLALVVRRDIDGVNSYAHIGTGNYNRQTAKIYTDLSLLTANQEICREVIEVFNYLTGRSLKKDYKHLLVAPINLKKTFIQLIEQEAKNALAGKPAQIMAKMNQLEDADIIQALYKASQAGVEVLLVVRGFCCLKAGIKGLSENITVLSLVGRFLEHSRVFYFRQSHTKKEKGKFYMGSADWMHRNLHNRVEVIIPVYSEEAQNYLLDFFTIMKKDNRLAWKLQPSGQYVQKRPAKSHKEFNTHEILMNFYKNRG